jgi:hypothetical protein
LPISWDADIQGCAEALRGIASDSAQPTIMVGHPLYSALLARRPASGARYLPYQRLLFSSKAS